MPHHTGATFDSPAFSIAADGALRGEVRFPMQGDARWGLEQVGAGVCVFMGGVFS